MTKKYGKDQEDDADGSATPDEARNEAARLIDPAMPMAAAGAVLDSDRELDQKSETEEALERVTEAEDKAEENGDDEDDDDEEEDEDDEEADDDAAADEEEQEDEGIEEAEELDDR